MCKVIPAVFLAFVFGTGPVKIREADEPTKPEPIGPLRVLKSNPRYFTVGDGMAVYLAGSHNWHNFQDNGHRLTQGKDPPEAFDYDAYLDFLQKHHHNFFRL